MLRVRNFLPRGLYGRAALILIVPIVTIQLVVSTAFIQRHIDRVTEQLTYGVILEVEYARAEIAAATDIDTARAEISLLRTPLELRFDLPAGPDAPVVDANRWFDLSAGAIQRSFREGMKGVLAVDVSRDDGWVLVHLETPKGPMVLGVSRGRLAAANPHQLLVLMILTSILMTVIAYAFLRNQLRPITHLAEAAEALGKGQHVKYRPRGALEVRKAGNAFLDMRVRIERQIEQRTLMLSGVSHDLRTPLTRLRLGLSMLPEEEEAALMLGDVADMERLVDEFLSFARGDAMEGAQAVNPADLLQQVVENARRAGVSIALVSVSGEGVVTLRPQAVMRALENLINNAHRFGKRVEVSLAIEAGHVRFTIEDDGPGIPENRRDEALRPFTRLDAARDPNRGGGVGLGLSIAVDIARSHGGTLNLGQGVRLGGLRVDLVIAR